MTTFEIKRNSPDYDHDNVYIDGKCVGFVGKSSGNFFLIRCPKCGLENYYMAAVDGVCAKCGHKPELPSSLYTESDFVEISDLTDKPEVLGKGDKAYE